MSVRLEDYALIGDLHGSALVARSGSIDWLTLPRFDSPAAFSALLGTEDHGYWLVAPTALRPTVTRRYRGETLVLETTFETNEGAVRLIDCMPLDPGRRTVVRVVEGVRGEVEMRCELVPRFDYGSILPWFTVGTNVAAAIGGPDALALHTPIPLDATAGRIVGAFRVKPGERIPFTLTWYRSHHETPGGLDAEAALAETEAWWSQWSRRCTYQGPYREAVVRSLIVLKALTFAPTGAIVAAPTTSLPEQLGGIRNWDYRFCWLRDATFTVLALMNAGYADEAGAFTDWLLRAIAGDPAKLQIMYGVSGERRLLETELRWLPGYGGSRPVRVGNAAHAQFQLDVYGEVIDALYQAIRGGMPPHPGFWRLLRGIVDFVSRHWKHPGDHGMWEIRGRPRHFTESKVMAWVAFDRAVKAIEAGEFEGPIEQWRALRDEVHADILARGYDARRNTFVQDYGSEQLDASLLLLWHVGFLPPEDLRIRGTVAAIERELFHPPFVRRYSTAPGKNVDGLPSGEGAFLACSFWLADSYAVMGRDADARTLFEQLLALRNDVGLLSEEYDIENRRLIGNFPQAFSHLALVNTALNLLLEEGPATQRGETGEGVAPGESKTTAP